MPSQQQLLEALKAAAAALDSVLNGGSIINYDYIDGVLTDINALIKDASE